MPGRTGRKRPHQIVDDLVTVGSKALVDQLGVAEEVARELMRQVAHEFCFINAKNVIYIPEDLDFELTARDERIWTAYQLDGPDGVRKFTGPRVEQLAYEHKLSTQQIYNIIRLAKKREIAGRQGVLPGMEEA